MFGRVKPLDAILATAEKKALHRSLEARGLVVRLGAETPVAAPRPLDDRVG